MLTQFFTSEQLSAEAYHAESRHESSTVLKKLILQSPAHYLRAKETASPDNDDFAFGRAIHAAVLESETFHQRFLVLPEVNRKTKKGREFIEAATAMARQQDKQLLRPEDFAHVNFLRDSLYRSEKARRLLSVRGLHEASFFWTDEKTGINLKIRPDRVFEFDGEYYYVSFKSARSAAKADFAYDIGRFGYAFSEAMYLEGLTIALSKRPHCIWLVSEKETGFVTAYEPSPFDLEEGHKQYRDALDLLVRCRAENHFWGYQKDDESEVISIPRRSRQSTTLLAA